MHPIIPMGNLYQMLVFSRGVQPYFRIPRPQVPFRTIVDMRAAYECYNDRDFLQFNENPPMHTPIPPAPAQYDQVVPDSFIPHVPEAPSPLYVIEHYADDSNATDSDMEIDLDDDSEYNPHFDR